MVLKVENSLNTGQMCKKVWQHEFCLGQNIIQLYCRAGLVQIQEIMLLVIIGLKPQTSILGYFP